VLRPLQSLATVVVLFASRAFAGDIGPVEFAFNGFGTLGVLHSDYRKADFVTSALFHQSGVGYSHAWSAAQDSNLGAQLTADFGKRLTATVQVVSQLRYDNTFRPNLEWANIKYQILPELEVRAGRIVLPTFLTSETQTVGYVNPWVRTPAEVLVQLPITNSDGVDIAYRWHLGGASNRLQVLYGRNEAGLPTGGTFRNTGIFAVTDTIEAGALTAHLGYQRMHYSFPDESLVESPEYSFQAFEAGATYDPGGWYVTGDAFNTHDEGVGRTESFYVGGGYRIGKFTPYLETARIRQTSVGTFGLGPAYNQKSSAIGMRWDFWRNFDAKVQYDRIFIHTTLFPASFVNLQPGFRAGDHANVVSATLDFVW
jgi:hypothetical protein